MALGPEQPGSVAAIALAGALPVARGEKVGICARKRVAREGCARAPSPLPVSPFFVLVGAIGVGSEYLDQDVIPAQTEGRCLLRYARRRTPKFVSEDGAARPGRVARRFYGKIDALAVESGQPAGVHEDPQPVRQIWIEGPQQGAVRHRLAG